MRGIPCTSPAASGRRSESARPFALRAAFATFVALALTLPLASPAAPAPRTESLPLQGYSPIALTRLKTGHLTLQARINGVAGRFVLDTGAGRSVIELGRQSKFGLTRLDAKSGVATGAGGSLPLRISHGNRLQIGGYSDYGFTAYLMPLDQVNLAFLQRGQPRVDGVIGADVLRSGNAVIDYAGNTLYLRPRAVATSATNDNGQAR